MLRRFMGKLAESDEVRLAEELREWAATIPGTVRIDDAEPRTRVRVAVRFRDLPAGLTLLQLGTRTDLQSSRPYRNN